MSELARLAERAGLDTEYFSFAGERVVASEEAIRAILAAMRLPVEDEAAIEAAAGGLKPVDRGPIVAPAGVACHMPSWLADGRAWGVACQIYGLVSDRNAGIGDFEDLARLAEIAAAAGADFLGVSPLHALFLAAPERCSPFFPSNRQFLNPLFIALDQVPGAAAANAPLSVPPGGLVDYPAVAAFKREALGRLHAAFLENATETEAAELAAYKAERGEALSRHALFEAISEVFVEDGGSPTWHGWPEEFRSPTSDAVREFAADNAELVHFHSWLQWVADRQLAEAQRRAKAAGMRIGLYLDLAVGVAPDGSATWSDPTLTVNGASIGAPPDYYDARGQDWGLAPVSPLALAEKDGEPFREAIDAAIRHAGALRIDHAMSIFRLFWVPWGQGATAGVYVRYPLQPMLKALAAASSARQAIIIGEDLGLVPVGFREMMKAMEIQGYRVFHFERENGSYMKPRAYPREALACITTHDLPTLAGWWRGDDIKVRLAIGIADEAGVAAMAKERQEDRHRIVWALGEAGLVPPGFSVGAPEDAELTEALAVSMHRHVARAPSRLFAVALEDLIGATRQVNIPGTSTEYPNWCTRLELSLDEIERHARFRAISAALREERPK